MYIYINVVGAIHVPFLEPLSNDSILHIYFIIVHDCWAVWVGTVEVLKQPPPKVIIQFIPGFFWNNSLEIPKQLMA